jgi:hypothetical protein
LFLVTDQNSVECKIHRIKCDLWLLLPLVTMLNINVSLFGVFGNFNNFLFVLGRAAIDAVWTLTIKCVD